MLLLHLLACAAPFADPPCGGDEILVSVATDDGEVLAADWWPGPAAGAPVVVLLHMVPPSNDRRGWPQRVRAALAGAGAAVLNLDRRGAGGSTGDPEAAYLGPGGLHDVEAAVRFATADARACPASGVVLIGASNGTTSALDYLAAHGAALPHPRAFAMLSPGAYTENQHEVDGAWDRDVPGLWLHPDDEPWAEERLRPVLAPSWGIAMRGSVHGTRMFDGGALEDAVVADLVALVTGAVARP